MTNEHNKDCQTSCHSDSLEEPFDEVAKAAVNIVRSQAITLSHRLNDEISKTADDKSASV